MKQTTNTVVPRRLEGIVTPKDIEEMKGALLAWGERLTSRYVDEDFTYEGYGYYDEDPRRYDRVDDYLDEDIDVNETLSAYFWYNVEISACIDSDGDVVFQESTIGIDKVTLRTDDDEIELDRDEICAVVPESMQP